MKEFTFRIIAGANIATIVVMLLIGYSDRVNPTAHPLIANLGLLFPVFLVANLAFLAFWLMFRARWALIPVAGLLIGFQPIRIYTPFNRNAATPEGSIKVMSYNVFYFSTWDDTDEPSEILSYIKRQNPDILCMQEFGSTGRKREIADSTLSAFYPHHDSADSPEGGDEICIYSRFPIVGKEKIEYASKGNNSAAFRVVTAKGDTTIVVVNHFETTGLSLDDRSKFHAMIKGDIRNGEAEQESRRLWHKLGEASAIRAPQADAVAEYVERHKGQSIILVGDFNDSPISYVRRRLASVLNDCYVASANGPGISYHYNAFYVRIDNIMCSAHWTPYRCHVDNSIKASDHYPIICWLKKG